MKIIVIGGKGTIGSAAIKELSKHDIIIAGHTHGDVKFDMTSPDSIKSMFEEIGKFDAVIVAAGDAHFEPFAQMTPEKYKVGLNSKLMGQVNIVLFGSKFIQDNGSFTLTSGSLAHDPVRGGSSASMVNAAIDGFVRAAAIELKRGIRLNAVSPTILEESMVKYGAYFSGHIPVPASKVAKAYSKSVEGGQTGQIYRVWE